MANENPCIHELIHFFEEMKELNLEPEISEANITTDGRKLVEEFTEEKKVEASKTIAYLSNLQLKDKTKACKISQDYLHFLEELQYTQYTIELTKLKSDTLVQARVETPHTKL
ncbi:MAG: hypothetical protein V3W20_08695 [Candidatus Neomarinimicrobiota bacterium]